MLLPSQIELLIYFHIHPEPHPESGEIWYETAFRFLVDQALVKVAPNSEGTGIEARPVTFTTTKRGRALVKMICDTPLPEQQWIDPRNF